MESSRRVLRFVSRKCVVKARSLSVGGMVETIDRCCRFYCSLDYWEWKGWELEGNIMCVKWFLNYD